MRAREVVNATGVWTDDVQDLVGERGKFQVRASKGVHLVVPRDRMQLDTGLILRTEKSRAVRHPVGPPLDHRHDRHRLGARQGPPGGHVAPTSTTCSSTSTRCSTQPLTREDVEGVYAGLRPLLTGESREHVASSRASTRSPCRCRAWSPSPAASTRPTASWRATRRRRRARARPRRARRPPPHVTPLVGADGFQALWNQRDRLAAEYGVHVARIEHLLRRYGSRDPRAARDDRATSPSSASRSRAPTTTSRSRSRYAVTHEGALHLDDVLTPPHPHLDRDLRPRPRRGRARGAA